MGVAEAGDFADLHGFDGVFDEAAAGGVGAVGGEFPGAVVGAGTGGAEGASAARNTVSLGTGGALTAVLQPGLARMTRSARAWTPATRPKTRSRFIGSGVAGSREGRNGVEPPEVRRNAARAQAGPSGEAK